MTSVVVVVVHSRVWPADAGVDVVCGSVCVGEGEGGEERRTRNG